MCVLPDLLEYRHVGRGPAECSPAGKEEVFEDIPVGCINSSSAGWNLRDLRKRFALTDLGCRNAVERSCRSQNRE